MVHHDKAVGAGNSQVRPRRRRGRSGAAASGGWGRRGIGQEVRRRRWRERGDRAHDGWRRWRRSGCCRSGCRARLQRQADASPNSTRPAPSPAPAPFPQSSPPCASCGQRQRRSLEDLAPDPPAERLEVPGQRSPSDVGRAAPERGQHITALGADVAGRLEPGRPRPRPRQLPRAVGGPRGGPHSTAPILAARRELDHLTTLGAGSGSNAATRARCRPEELLSPNNSAIRAMTQ